MIATPPAMSGKRQPRRPGAPSAVAGMSSGMSDTRMERLGLAGGVSSRSIASSSASLIPAVRGGSLITGAGSRFS